MNMFGGNTGISLIKNELIHVEGDSHGTSRLHRIFQHLCTVAYHEDLVEIPSGLKV